MGLAALWERRVFPRLMDRALRGLGDEREAALAAAEGEVLEVGFGTGLNLPHYPKPVTRVVGLDPLDALRERVAARIAAAPFPVERVGLSADGRLPFESGRFDTVAMTWTLCSIPDPAAALAEMRRVLRPGGRLLFVEHGASDEPRVARWQRRLEPVHRRIAGGCHLTRRIDVLVRDAGFALERLERYRLPEGPAVFSEMYRGAARPAEGTAGTVNPARAAG